MALHFKFSDGTTLKPDELGYISFKWASDWAANVISEMLGEGKPASTWVLSETLSKSPFVAHLYLSAFDTAIYLTFISTILLVQQDVISEFHVGLKAALHAIRGANDMPIDPDTQEAIIRVIARASLAIDADLIESEKADPRVYIPTYSLGTSFIMNLLQRAYGIENTHQNQAMPISVDSMILGGLLDDRPSTLMTILQQHHKLSLVHA